MDASASSSAGLSHMSVGRGEQGGCGGLGGGPWPHVQGSECFQYSNWSIPEPKVFMTHLLGAGGGR